MSLPNSSDEVPHVNSSAFSEEPFPIQFADGTTIADQIATEVPKSKSAETNDPTFLRFRREYAGIGSIALDSEKTPNEN